jgi:hypothetical protein
MFLDKGVKLYLPEGSEAADKVRSVGMSERTLTCVLGIDTSCHCFRFYVVPREI